MRRKWRMMIVIVVGLLVAPVPLSYLVESLRTPPAPPTLLSWASEVPIRYAKVDDMSLRYIKVGQGRPLVLLHTLRTQLDMFQKVIPALSKHFEVYAVDSPGHGFSDIPRVEYTPEFFIKSVAGLLADVNVEQATVVGESIGGTIALVLAARHHPRVQRVIAINAYDYDGGRGLRRSSGIANLLFGLNNVPILGSTFMRLRQYDVFRKIMEGGVFHADALPPALLHEMYSVGNRPNHYQAFMSLVAHWAEWEKARREYARIQIPVLFVYGAHDWSRPGEREANRTMTPGSRMTIVSNAGHFLSLDAPENIIQLILSFRDAQHERT